MHQSGRSGIKLFLADLFYNLTKNVFLPLAMPFIFICSIVVVGPVLEPVLGLGFIPFIGIGCVALACFSIKALDYLVENVWGYRIVNVHQERMRVQKEIEFRRNNMSADEKIGQMRSFRTFLPSRSKLPSVPCQNNTMEVQRRLPHVENQQPQMRRPIIRA